MEKKTRHARLNDKSTTRTNRSFSRPRPRAGAIRALQESHKSITMASITSSAVFGKVSALKASKSVKRCVRYEDDSFGCLARRSRAGSRRAESHASTLDALVSRPRDPWIAIAGRVVVRDACERRDGRGRRARCAGRANEFFDAHRARCTERRRSASTLGVHVPWGSYRGSLAIEDDRDDMRFVKPTARDRRRGFSRGSAAGNETGILILVSIRRVDSSRRLPSRRRVASIPQR